MFANYVTQKVPSKTQIKVECHLIKPYASQPYAWSFNVNSISLFRNPSLKYEGKWWLGRGPKTMRITAKSGITCIQMPGTLIELYKKTLGKQSNVASRRADEQKNRK